MILIDVRALRHSTVRQYVEKLALLDSLVFARPPGVAFDLGDDELLHDGVLVSASKAELPEPEFWQKVFQAYPASAIVTDNDTALASSLVWDEQPPIKLVYNFDLKKLEVF